VAWHQQRGAEAIVRNDFTIARGKGTSKHGKRFGEGAYFAEDLDKSLSYATPDENGRTWVLLCRVVCGDYYYTENKKEVDAHQQSSRAGKHSVLANPEKKGPREFIIQMEKCVYPEFCLELDVEGDVEDWMMEPDYEDEVPDDPESDDGRLQQDATSAPCCSECTVS